MIILFWLDGFINVIKGIPQVHIKIKDMLDKCNRLLYTYQSKIRDRSCLISSNIVEKYASI